MVMVGIKGIYRMIVGTFPIGSRQITQMSTKSRFVEIYLILIENNEVDLDKSTRGVRGEGSEKSIRELLGDHRIVGTFNEPIEEIDYG